MTKRILAASDLSGPSNEVLRQAYAQATAVGGSLAVCHVLANGLGVNALFPNRNLEGILATADLEREVHAALADQISACIPGAAVEIFIEAGGGYGSIVRRAEAWSADLVLIGSEGRTQLPRLHLGSTAEQVVRHAHCPVLVVRSTPSRGIVLVATDLSDPSIPAVAAGADQARQRGAKLVVVHAIEFGSVKVTIEEIVRDVTGRASGWNIDGQIRQDVEAQLQRALAQCNAEGEVRVVDGVPAASVVRAADELGAELVVVGTRGRTGIVRVALGSTAERIVRSAACSVLAVRLG